MPLEYVYKLEYNVIMMNKTQLKIINFIMCLSTIAFMMPIEVRAMDSPKDGYIEEFPVPGNSDTVITDNYGTINYAKTGGAISYNFYLINNLEGATVGENKDIGTIDKFVAGKVENNCGTINYINNTASIGTNTPSGVIKENFNDIAKNMGTIENQYSGTIKENYGNVGIIGASATIEKLYEGIITENSGNIVVSPAPEGILTEVKIGTNKKSVTIEADPDNKSSVAIDSNEEGASLHVCKGADCIVTDNAGKIEIEEGGTCNITGTNTGEVINIQTPSGEEYDYRLILDNMDPSDITLVDFFKKDGDNIYVMSGGSDHNVIVSYDTNKYFYPDAVKIRDDICIKIENSEYSVIDDVNKTFTIHFHSMGEYVHSSGEKHIQKCGGTWNGAECKATFNEESCSLIPATCISKAKCEKCGTEYGYLSHHSYSWVCENGKHKQVCTLCSDTKNIGTCSYGEWIIDSEAKVGVEGKKHRVCSVCNGVENATIPAKSDNEGKKTDKKQSGNEQDVKPTKKDPAKEEKPTKKDPAQDIKPTKKDPAKEEKPTKKDPAQDIKPTNDNPAQDIKPTKDEPTQDIIPTRENPTQVVNSNNKNSAQVENQLSDNHDIQKGDNDISNSDDVTKNNSEGRDEGVENIDSMNIDSDSEVAIDDSKSSEQEMEEKKSFENSEEVSASSMSNVGIIGGVFAFATAATAGFFAFSRKRRGKI